MKILDYEIDPEKVRSYVPLKEKAQFFREAASGCFDRMEISAEQGENSLPLPPMYQENLEKKERYRLGGFLRLYLGVDFEGDGGDPWLAPVELYDDAEGMGAARYVNNSLRLMLMEGVQADWEETERMFFREIENLLEVMNDPVTRILAAMQLQTGPEAMEQAAAGLAQAKEDLQQYLKEKQAAQAKKDGKKRKKDLRRPLQAPQAQPAKETGEEKED